MSRPTIGIAFGATADCGGTKYLDRINSVILIISCFDLHIPGRHLLESFHGPKREGDIYSSHSTPRSDPRATTGVPPIVAPVKRWRRAELLLTNDTRLRVQLKGSIQLVSISQIRQGTVFLSFGLILLDLVQNAKWQIPDLIRNGQITNKPCTVD